MNNLIALVACGGQSTRMTTDKSLLQYHASPQRYYVYILLKNVCSNVYLSINTSQQKSVLNNFNYFVDDEQYKNIGPMAALLTAKNKLPNCSILFIGCDYPLLEITDIEKLILNRNKFSDAICYFNPLSNFAEPMLALYEFECLQKMEKYFNTKQFSLRHFLTTINTLFIEPNNANNIKSVDTIDDYKLILNKLNNK